MDTGAIERWCLLRVAQLERRRLLPAQAQDGSDAVAGEDAELSRHLFFGGACIPAFHVRDVRMRVDQTRSDGFSANIENLCAARRLHFVRRPDRDHLPVLDDQRAVLDRSLSSTVKYARAGEGLDLRRRGASQALHEP